MIRDWANLLAVFNGQEEETEKKKGTASDVSVSDENGSVNKSTSI
jgi:hypothetical protein